MEVRLERRGGVAFLRVDGDLRLWNHPQAEQLLWAARRSALDEAGPELVLSLCGVTAVDSMGIGALARIVTGCASRNISLKVAMPRGFPREVLERVGIFKGWPRFQDEASAPLADA